MTFILKHNLFCFKKYVCFLVNCYLISVCNFLENAIISYGKFKPDLINEYFVIDNDNIVAINQVI
jgi:hypothetical protein